MKKQNTSKAKPSAPCPLGDVWPLLAAYTDLAERHAALLADNLHRTLADAKQAHRNAEIEAQVAKTLDEVEAAIMAMPAPKLF